MAQILLSGVTAATKKFSGWADLINRIEDKFSSLYFVKHTMYEKDCVTVRQI